MVDWIKALYKRMRPFMDSNTASATDRCVDWGEYMEVLAQSVDTGLSHGLLTGDDRSCALDIIDRSSYFRKWRDGYRAALTHERELVAA